MILFTDSSSVGFSGNLEVIECNTCHVARPNSAL